MKKSLKGKLSNYLYFEIKIMSLLKTFGIPQKIPIKYYYFLLEKISPDFSSKCLFFICTSKHYGLY